MNRHSLLRHARAVPGLLGLAVLVACDSPAEVAPAHEHMHEAVAAPRVALASAGPLAKQVHAKTARFHSTEQATRAGYEVSSPCVAVPGLGTMGFHWVKMAAVDPVFDPFEPEAVLYVPDAQGNLKLVAVEYIVIDVDQPAPTFAGQPFDVGGAPIPAPHWTLHVWVHEANPGGMFAPFNPNVSCP